MPRALKPLHCRPQAFRLFAAQLDRLETPEGLVHAAVAVSMHELEGVEPARVDAGLSELADVILGRLRGRSPQALLAHAHAYLFDDLGFRGNEEDYGHPFNSYLPAVLQSRRGLPITLVLVYKSVLERIGLRVHGINAPAHFLARVEPESGERPIFIDPFFRGREVSREEAARRVEQATGMRLPDPAQALPVATHRQWLARMIQNLQGSFAQAERTNDLAAMLELRGLLRE